MLSEHATPDTLKTTTPLVTRALLAWLATAFAHANHVPGAPPARGIAYGVGLSFALFAMQGMCVFLTICLIGDLVGHVHL